jgi:hypothetical protein
MNEFVQSLSLWILIPEMLNIKINPGKKAGMCWMCYLHVSGMMLKFLEFYNLMPVGKNHDIQVFMKKCCFSRDIEKMGKTQREV